MVSRRKALRRAASLLGAAGLSGCSRLLGPSEESPRLGLDPNPADVPDRQHAWNGVLRTDRHGNHLLPQYHRVLLLDLDAEPDRDVARTVERAMRTVERAFEWSPEGLLHALAWGPEYLDRLGALDRAPIRRPQVLSRTDDPELSSHDAALVLASESQAPPLAVEGAMFGDSDRLADVAVEDRLDEAFSIAGRRTGFIGQGLPAEHADAEGIPDGAPLSAEDPMFMGFFSGMARTQASEDRVTIDSGRFAGGTTMHLSHLRQSLDGWYGALDEAGRVARMFSSAHTPADVDSFTTGSSFDGLGDGIAERARESGVAGHLEKVVRARRDGEPLVLRRDFNTVDGGRAGVHFLSLQKKISHFERARDAMNGWWLRDEHEAITDRENNGILNFITVVSRTNFYVPPRSERSFPLFRG